MVLLLELRIKCLVKEDLEDQERICFFICKYSADNVVEWELPVCVCE